MNQKSVNLCFGETMQLMHDNEIWIGIYDEPYYRRRVHIHVNCWGGMGKYEFCDFYNYKEIENERDLQTQEKLLEVLNMLIDEGILKIPIIRP